MYINPNTYFELDDCYQLKILCNNVPIYTYFDKAYYDILNKYHWRVSQKRNKYYVCTGHGKNGNKIRYMSNIIMNFTPDRIHEVDHIDGDSLNNRCNNLRVIDRLSNIHNVKVRIDNKTTGVRGISFDKRYNLYRVDFSYNKKRLYLKPMKSLNEAVYARRLCEEYFLPDIRNTSNDTYTNRLIDNLSDTQKLSLEKYINDKIMHYMDMIE